MIQDFVLPQKGRHRGPSKSPRWLYTVVATASAFVLGAATVASGATSFIRTSPSDELSQAQVLITDAQAQLNASPSPTSTPTPTPSPSPTVTPTTYDHVFLVPMENQPRSSVIGSSSWPVVNSLATSYAQASHYTASCHPSLPNYLDFTSGSTQGKCGGNDASPILNVPNLFGDLTTSGVSWKSYVQDLPADSTQWNVNTGSEWEIGNYAAKHEPAVFYQSVMGSATERAKVVNYTQLATDLSTGTAPVFNYVGLNMINDGHDSCCAQADSAVNSVVNAIKASTAWTQQRSLIIVTWDEGVSTNQTVAFIAIAKDAKTGFVSSVAYGHHNLLSTIEKMTGDKSDRSGGAAVMSDLFTSGTSTSPSPSPTPTVTAATVSSTHAFSPPTLTNPVTKQLTDNSGALHLTIGVDYILKCPTSGTWHNAVGMFLIGGRNVVFQNCTVDVGDGSGTAPAGNEPEKRGGYVDGPVQFYGENLSFLSSTQGHLTEGIDLAGDANTVTLQGITVQTLHGSFSTNHADCMQAWAGPSVLQVDGYNCTSGYQGFFLLPDQHSTIVVHDWDVRNVQLTMLAGAGYSLWRDDNLTGYTIHTTNVTCTGGRGTSGLWPSASAWPGVIIN